MNNKKSIPYLLSIIILLVICSATSIGYIIGISKTESNQQNNNTPFLNENEAKINSEIAKLKSIYNTKIVKKTASYNELEQEKTRVQELLIELEKVKGNETLLLKYKDQYQTLESKMRFMVDEIAVLKRNKVKAVIKVNTTKPKIVTPKKTIINPNPPTTKYIYLTPKKLTNPLSTKTEVIKNNPIIETKIAETKTDNLIPEWSVTNLQAMGYIFKSSAKHEISALAKKVDFIKISFTVLGNSNIKSEEKKYYIQVINSKNNVLGVKTTEYIDGKTLTYSAVKSIPYDGQNIQVAYDLKANKFEKGNYFVTIYDRSKLMAKTSFILK